MDRPAHPQQAGAGGSEGGESVREVVGIERKKKKDGTAEGGTPFHLFWVVMKSGCIITKYCVNV
jgi:hypothetical protein